MAGKVVLFDDFADHALGFAVAVYVGRVPCIETTVVGAFEEFVHFVHVIDDPWLPVSVTCLSNEGLGQSIVKEKALMKCCSEGHSVVSQATFHPARHDSSAVPSLSRVGPNIISHGDTVVQQKKLELTEGHGAQYGNRHSKTGSTQLDVVDLGVFQALRERSRHSSVAHLCVLCCRVRTM